MLELDDFKRKIDKAANHLFEDLKKRIWREIIEWSKEKGRENILFKWDWKDLKKRIKRLK